MTGASETPRNESGRRYLFIFSHNMQIRWYQVFAEGFREMSDRHRTVLFVHGHADAQLARSLGCYDEVCDLVETFRFDPMLAIEKLKVGPEIGALEAHAGLPFFWDDIRTDRWLRADERPSFQIQYLNHVAKIVSDRFASLSPVAALGEYTMAAYRLAHRLLASHGRPMFYPIATRYYPRFYLETSLDWKWKRCIELYHTFLESGVPDELVELVRPHYESIALKYSRPNYTTYQNQFQTGFVQLHKLSPAAFIRKVVAALTSSLQPTNETNPRLNGAERGVLQRIRRMVRERRNYHAYRGLIQKTLPEGLCFGVYFFHYQPEYTSDALGRFYMDQQFLIANIAASLPAGMFLVVKEHPTMIGLRNADVYRKLQAVGNIILVDHTFDSVELIKRSQIVFTIVGTPALEAMFIGKPAIMFGEHAFCRTNLISFCPDFWSLGKMVQQKLAEQTTPEEVRRHAIAILAGKYAGSLPGQVPIAAEFIEPFLDDRANYAEVKTSFQNEISRVVA